MNHLIMCLVVNVVIRLFFILSRDCYFPLLFSFLWLSTLHCQHFGLVKCAAAYYTTLLYSLHTHTQKQSTKSSFNYAANSVSYLGFPAEKIRFKSNGGKNCCCAKRHFIYTYCTHFRLFRTRNAKRKEVFLFLFFFLKEIVSRPNR